MDSWADPQNSLAVFPGELWWFCASSMQGFALYFENTVCHVGIFIEGIMEHYT